MNAVNSARKLIFADPDSTEAKVLTGLIEALQSQTEINVADLYALDFGGFEIAMDMLREWRIDRYYVGQARPFSLPAQASTFAS